MGAVKIPLNKKTPSGEFVRHEGGYVVFVPRPLPPEPLPVIDAALARLLSHADQSLGRLDGVVTTLRVRSGKSAACFPETLPPPAMAWSSVCRSS